MTTMNIVDRLSILEEQNPGFLSDSEFFPRFAGDFSQVGNREMILMQLHLLILQAERDFSKDKHDMCILLNPKKTSLKVTFAEDNAGVVRGYQPGDIVGAKYFDLKKDR